MISKEQGKTIRTLDDVITLVEALKANPGSQPEYLSILPKTVIQLWHYEQLRRLYTDVMPKPPKRLLRKAVMRRLQARISQGRRRIARREREAEKLCLQLGDLVDATLSMPPLSSKRVIMHVTYKGRGEPLPFDVSE